MKKPSIVTLLTLAIIGIGMMSITYTDCGKTTFSTLLESYGITMKKSIPTQTSDGIIILSDLMCHTKIDLPFYIAALFAIPSLYFLLRNATKKIRSKLYLKPLADMLLFAFAACIAVKVALLLGNIYPLLLP